MARVKVKLSHVDKVLFPEIGLTKRDLADYYERVAPQMLRQIKGRPIAMQRFPEGIDKPGFFFKSVPPYFPDWIARVEVAKRDGRITQALVCDADTLAYLANQDCVTLHVWLSRAPDVEHPDRLIFDLDPPQRGFPATRRAAAAVRELLEELGLAPFLMSTGSRGLHVWVPLRPRAGFDEVREFARELGELLCRRHPDELTLAARKSKRGNRVLIDIMRNAYAQTAVAPYAVRPRPQAPVATPLRWEELQDPRLRPDGVTTRTMPARLEELGDPWANMARHARELAPARKRLTELVGGEGG